jgi:hypothetical protein
VAGDTIWQPGWRWCSRCQGLSYQGTGSRSGRCWDGEPHDGNDSRPYFVLMGPDPSAGMQDGWRWCNRCQGLAYAGFGTGVCWDGNGHDFGGSGAYAVDMAANPAGTQDGWHWCNRCQGMIYSGFGTGVCWDGQGHDFGGSGGYSIRYTRSRINDLFPDLAAASDAIRRAIEAKAAALGPAFTGARQGVVAAGISSWEVAATRYERCTIFYRAGVGAFEIHGAIREKYELLDLGRVLGMPVTDESSCADGAGRFNRFTGGVIYWHPNSGPFALHGPILDTWRHRGAERGPLGYPIADELATPDGATAVLFQNGALSQQNGVVTDAAFAFAPRGLLVAAVRGMFDRMVRERGQGISLREDATLDKVGQTGGGLRRALNRPVFMTVNGRHTGSLAVDAVFAVHLGLRLTDTRHADATRPGWDLVAELVSHSVDAYGVYGPVASAVRDGINGAITDAFREPRRVAEPADPRRPTFPEGSGFVGAIVLGDGTLLLLFTDTVPGRIAAVLAQRAVDGLADA